MICCLSEEGLSPFLPISCLPGLVGRPDIFTNMSLQEAELRVTALQWKCPDEGS